jgi:hypothetical protein
MTAFEFGSAWSLTERPRRVEVAMALLFAINLATTAATEIEISWLWFAVGILAWAAIVGPISASSLGHTVGEWFGRIGVAGRLLGIAVVIGVFWIVVPVLDFSPIPFYSFGFGGMFVITVLILVRYAGSVVRQALD